MFGVLESLGLGLEKLESERQTSYIPGILFARTCISLLQKMFVFIHLLLQLHLPDRWTFVNVEGA
jgi:hypothetical protein